MPTKLDRIKNMEEELAKLKEQVEEEEKVPEITVGCVVKNTFGAFLVTKMCISGKRPYNVVTIDRKKEDVRIGYCNPDGSILNTKNITLFQLAQEYKFVASSLEEYYKQKGGCCGKCKKEE